MLQNSWIPGVFPGYGSAALWFTNFTKHPAYYGIVDALTNGKKVAYPVSIGASPASSAPAVVHTAATVNAPKPTATVVASVPSSAPAVVQTAASLSAPKQSVASVPAPKQSVASSAAPKQSVASVAAPKQSGTGVSPPSPVQTGMGVSSPVAISNATHGGTG